MMTHDQSRLTPPGIRRKYPERLKIPENLVGNATKDLSVKIAEYKYLS